jgi:hypothetical protein
MAAVAKHSCGSIGSARPVSVWPPSWLHRSPWVLAAAKEGTPNRYGALAGRLGSTERYGVVLPKGSKLRAVVSKAVLALQRDGTIRKAAAASFGPTLGSIPVIR